MLAVQLVAPGQPDALRIADVPEPEPGPGEVVVRFEASTINPADLKARNGLYTPRAGTPPYVLGWDLVGRVESGSASGAVDGLAPGTRVVGMSAMASTGRGTWSELVALPATSLAAVPETVAHLDPVILAQLPLVGLTALQAVDDLGLDDLAAGDPAAGQAADVLVIGAAGAVGSIVVQLLLARGIRPRTLARNDAPPEPADLIVDAAGIGLGDALRPGGRYVAVVPGTGPEQLPDGATRTVVRVPESGERLRTLLDLVAAGTIRLGEPEVYPLHDVTSAFAAFERRGGRRIALEGPR